MKNKKDGFAATGVLYTILVIFLILMTTLLVTLSSRSKILSKLKMVAFGQDVEVKEYDLYANGKAVYFNPVTGLKCDVNDAVSTTGTKTGCMKWYAFNDNVKSSTVKLLLAHNTTALVAWNSSGNNADGMKEVKTELDKLVSESKWSVVPRLISADEIAKITGNTSFDASTSTYDKYFYLDSNSANQVATGIGTSKYAWLYDYTELCTTAGCNVEDSSNKGYWTSTPVYGKSTHAWRVFASGALNSYLVNDTTRHGVRPVITVSKSKLDPNEPDKKYIQDGLIVYYNGSSEPYVDGSDKYIRDFSGNNNHGKLINTNGTIEYKNPGYEFTSNSDYIESIKNLGLSGDPDFTVEVVYRSYGRKSTEPGNQDNFGILWFGRKEYINNGDSFSLSNSLDENIIPNFINMGVGKPIDISRIHSASVTKKSGMFSIETLKVCCDNDCTNNSQWGGNVRVDLPDSKLQIGRGWQYRDSIRTLDGVIYSVRIYNRVLTQEEIQHNYEIDSQKYNIK